MIRLVFSDRPTFKRLAFRQGLNIVLADKSGETKVGDHKTRNGAGKSSLIDVIKFVLGGDVRKGRDVLAAPELSEDTFGLEYKLADEWITVSRKVSDKGKIL